MYQGEGLRKIILVIVGFFCLFVLSQCRTAGLLIDSDPPPKVSQDHHKEGPPPWAPAHGYRAKHRYRYYPHHRVYYERERGVYFYYRDGHWKVSVSLPSHIRIDLNDYVTLEMDSDKPYEYDHEVVKRYPPGQLKKKKKGKGKWKD
jgi:hypothetical protein